MLRLLARTLRRQTIEHIPANVRIRLLDGCSRLLSVSPEAVTFRQRGILLGPTEDCSGELYLIQKVLPRLLGTKERLVLVDVGANIGDYSASLHRQFPNAQIHMFEPHPTTFRRLTSRFKSGNLHIHNLAIADSEGTGSIYFKSGNTACGHESMYPEVLRDLHGYDQVESAPVETTTLDAFVERAGIGTIDFLKIDTEGGEFKVLKGASNLLANGQIGCIQFEFNEMNIISRVFWKDFYDLLSPQYHLFRLKAESMLPIEHYRSADEVFLFQNYLAIHKDSSIAPP